MNDWRVDVVDGFHRHTLEYDGHPVCIVSVDGYESSWEVHMPGGDLASPLAVGEEGMPEAARRCAAEVWERYRPVYDHCAARAVEQVAALRAEIAELRAAKPIMHTEGDLRHRVELLNKADALRAQVPVAAADLLITRGGQRLPLSKETRVEVVKAVAADLHAQADALREQALRGSNG